MLKTSLYFCVFIVLLGCGSSDNNEPLVEKQTLNLELDYSESLQGTTVSPYAFRVSDSDKFTIGLSDLPSPFEFRKGIEISWRVDDFTESGAIIIHKIEGLNPQSAFKADVRLAFLTNTCSDSGADRQIYTGIQNIMPSVEIGQVEYNFELVEAYLLDVDGLDAPTRIGDIGLPTICGASPLPWEIKNLFSEDNTLFFESNSNGEAFIYFAVESVFRRFIEIYITEVEISIIET